MAVLELVLYSSNEEVDLNLSYKFASEARYEVSISNLKCRPGIDFQQMNKSKQNSSGS